MKPPFVIDDYVVATQPGRNLVVGQLYRVNARWYGNIGLWDTCCDDSWPTDHFRLATEEEITLSTAHPIP